MSGGLRTNFYDWLLKGCTALVVVVFFFLSGFFCLQGLYGSWKKVAGPGKFLKSVTLKFKNMKCIEASKEN